MRILGDRPFHDVMEMDKTIITNWNNTVGRGDDVWHLGDFGDDMSLVQQLNGNVHLILGNHEETKVQNDFGGDFPRYADYLMSLGFRSVTAGGKILYVPEIEDNGVYLTHKPMDCDKSRFNLFGHIHRLGMVKKFGLNVGTDCHWFKPISAEKINFFKGSIKNVYDENVFCDIKDLNFG